MPDHLFIAGVPATGKSWLGKWLAADRGFVHIDAERQGGADFDQLGVHGQWDQLIASGRAESFVRALDSLGKPVVVNWGFPTRYLYVVSALKISGVSAWWITADREQARAAFLARGGIDVVFFDRQMDDIDREWLLLESVFSPNIVPGLRSSGSQKAPYEIWADIGGR